MNRFVRRVSLLPELLKSMVESSSGNAQIEEKSKNMTTQTERIQNLRNDIQSHLASTQTQTTVIKSQKTKTDVLDKGVQVMSKILEDQVTEVENLKLLYQQETVKLQDDLTEKAKVIQEQSFKIAALHAENQRIESLLKARYEAFRSLRSQVATHVGEIKYMRKNTKELVKDIQTKVLLEISNLQTCHATETAARLCKIERLQLEVEKKGNQLRSQAVDIEDLRNATRDKSERLASLNTELKETMQQLLENEKTKLAMDKKMKAQATMNQTLVLKIENLWKNVRSKNKQIVSKNKEIQSLKCTITDITQKQ